MGRYGTSGGATFRVEGIAPSDLGEHPEPVRRMYWKWIVELVMAAKDRELAAGLDRHGLAMIPISKRTRKYRKSVKGPADPNAPPLQPAHSLSRTRSLFDGRAFPDRAEFFWRFDEFTGASWGRVLKFHARGEGHLPVRDVIGISPESLRWVRAQALARWMTWLRKPDLPPEGKRLRKNIATPKGWQIGQTREKPPRIEPTGRTDLENFTFGIGASRDEVQRMIDAGYFTGFRQLHTFKPGTGPSAQPPVPAPPKPPRPRERPDLARKIASPPDGIPTLPASRAKVVLTGSREERLQTTRTIKRIFGRKLTTKEIASVAGARDNATVEVRWSLANEISYWVKAPDLELVTGRIATGPGGVYHNVENVYVKRAERGHGIGAEIHMRQVAWGAQTGVDRLRLRANRSEEDRGYLVWPIFGYDGPIPAELAATMPERLKNLATLQEVLADEEGRDWWYAAGDTINLSFELHPGSPDRMRWAAYWASKRRSKP